PARGGRGGQGLHRHGLHAPGRARPRRRPGALPAHLLRRRPPRSTRAPAGSSGLRRRMTGHLGHQPLKGVRVIELDGIGPVPFACRLRHGLGAQVLRITRPESGPLGDVGRALTIGRPTHTVDLKTDAGRREVLDLLRRADVLVEGLRPGAMERLGLGPREVLRRHPKVVYARMTGWGQDGPLAQRAGHDITYAALAGVLHLAGSPEQPLPPANLLADFGGGSTFLVIG